MKGIGSDSRQGVGSEVASERLRCARRRPSSTNSSPNVRGSTKRSCDPREINDDVGVLDEFVALPW